MLSNGYNRQTAICPDCGRDIVISAKGRCHSCYDRRYRPKITCGNCATPSCSRNGTNVAGQPICKRCYNNLKRRPKFKCTNCGSDKLPRNGKTPDGKPVCKTCYVVLKLQPRIKCALCESSEHPGCATLFDGRLVCKRCYQKFQLQLKTHCANCGSDDFPRAGTTGSGDAVCHGCYIKLGVAPKVHCANCGSGDRPRNGLDVNGQPVCITCYRELGLQPLSKCSHCGREDCPRYSSTGEGNPICKRCYVALDLQPKITCVGCKQLAPAVGKNDKGDLVCSDCYWPYPCEIEECGHASKTAHQALAHARVHGLWKGKSTMEEWVYKQLTTCGFTQSRPQIDPREGPCAKQFWYNARVFSALRGLGGKRLECDFMVTLGNNHVVWIELQGLHHYQKRANAGMTLAQIQQHDQRRRAFASHQLPAENKTWSDLEYKEVPYFDFEKHFKPWLESVLGAQTETGTIGIASGVAESNERSRERRIEDYFRPVGLS